MNNGLAHIAPRPRFDGFVFDSAGARGCLTLAAAVRLEPFHPARPPAALVLAGLLQPSRGVLRIRAADPVAAPILGGGVDHARGVAARARPQRLGVPAGELAGPGGRTP